MTDLAKKRCVPCTGQTPRIEGAHVVELLAGLKGWSAASDGKSIAKKYSFENYHQTMAFVNAVAWIAHAEDHHPDLEVGYNRCVVRYSTHANGGLSENDFICAAKVAALGAE